MRGFACNYENTEEPELRLLIFSFFFNDTATTEIYTLSLHDALPIFFQSFDFQVVDVMPLAVSVIDAARSEEHTSELQSHHDLVCRLLLEKKKNHMLQQNSTTKGLDYQRQHGRK